GARARPRGHPHRRRRAPRRGRPRHARVRDALRDRANRLRAADRAPSGARLPDRGPGDRGRHRPPGGVACGGGARPRRERRVGGGKRARRGGGAGAVRRPERGADPGRPRLHEGPPGREVDARHPDARADGRRTGRGGARGGGARGRARGGFRARAGRRMTGRLRTLLARRASRARWGYVPALPALAFFTALGRDEGIPTVLYLMSLVVVCLRQLFRPTLLGWALLFVLFVLSTVSTLYTAAFYASHGVPIDRRQYVLLLASGGVPSATLLLRSEEHTSELQSRFDLVCRLLLEKK